MTEITLLVSFLKDTQLTITAFVKIVVSLYFKKTNVSTVISMPKSSRATSKKQMALFTLVHWVFWMMWKKPFAWTQVPIILMPKWHRKAGTNCRLVRMFSESCKLEKS
jgi:hypothetical protein